MVTAEETRLFVPLLRDALDRPGARQDLKRWCQWQGAHELARWVDRVAAVPEDGHYEIRRALSTGQVESKLWMLDLMRGLVAADRPLRVCVVGGWCGLLPMFLRAFRPFPIKSITQFDLDGAANAIAETMNWAPEDPAKFSAVTADALDCAYEGFDVIVNTSCEHFEKPALDRWLKRVPAGRYVFLQSNNFRGEPGHVNCHSNVFRFRESVDLRTYLFLGELPLERYRRFMVVGISRGGAPTAMDN